MAGHGPTPKDPEKRRSKSHPPTRGDWKAAAGTGWQHGDIPPAPAKMLAPSRTTWETWFRAWYAAHWRPEDVPALRQVIRLYDAVERGDLVRATELRLAEDTWGITPKGQQDRRWAPPKSWVDEPAEDDAEEPEETPEAPPSRYGHLRSVRPA